MILGLSGYAGAGKNTVANVLTHEYGFWQVAFADKLKAMALATDPIVHTHAGNVIQLREAVDLYGWDEAKRRFPEVRRYLQRLGTEGGRGTFGEDFWVDQLHAQIVSLADSGAKDFVITDMRFPNEAQYVRWQGGETVRIKRPGVRPANDHASETALDHWRCDWTILNDDTLDTLREEVKYMIGAMKNESV